MVSLSDGSQELAIFNYLPAVVKLGSERGPSSINTLAVYKSADGRQGDVNLYAPYLDLLLEGLFSGGNPPIYL